MEPVTVYAIYCEGKYLRKLGWRHQLEWCDNIDGAKLYVDEVLMNKHLNAVARSQARARVWGEPGEWPFLCEFRMEYVTSHDHSEQFVKNKERAEKAEATRRANFGKVREKEQVERVERLREQLKREEDQLMARSSVPR